ncbi:sigma-54-dependent transcriptional regulator [Desulfopila inferna]|uniref:sigma-54-dependent transcriptional regulator n=1 Tax=Desulfopila inferna TaxID=468528 RepID=UPI001965E37F|nr:sigma-54 dependent transcriptional regulator [Desulfopila inferna]MBM9603077.1 sigma-54-dependent Fis family transcriptional regulator [Desulfopila inferna]
MDNNSLLITDDEKDMRNGLKRILEKRFDTLDILTAASAEETLVLLHNKKIDILLLDIKMTGMSGLELLRLIGREFPELTVIMMTGYGSIETAVEAIKLGAYDFITKPFEREVIYRLIHKSIERNQLLKENSALKRQVNSRNAMEGFIGQSAAMLNFLDKLMTVARTHYTTLVRGASGTGKELTARAIHQLSARHDKPMITVNCPAIPEHLLESELFGHKKGAFTGASHDQIGLFKEADGGTICLDEVGDIPLSVQSKLLRVLQEGEIKQLGATRTEEIDVRVIALTNLDLEDMIEKRTFREDLFYRLNVVSIYTPSLSEITEDIPLLVNHFTTQVCRELNIERKHFDTAALHILEKRNWPGNVRELQNFVRRTIMFAEGDTITAKDLSNDIETMANLPDRKQFDNVISEDIIDYKNAKERMLDGFTQEYVRSILKKTQGNVSQSAELSGLSRTALQKILRRYDISSSDFKTTGS